MMKEKIQTSSAPAAVGPYSQAILSSNMIYTSGQLPLDPETMSFPVGGIKEQTRQVLTNITAILNEKNSGLENVIKTTCFITDINSFSDFNEVYSDYFDDSSPPARSCVEVSKLPKNALICIEVIAYAN